MKFPNSAGRPAEHKIALTDFTLKALKPRSKRYVVWDALQPALGIRVTPFGVVSYAVYKRDRTGKLVNITLGRYPDMSLATAREKTRKILVALSEGRGRDAFLRDKVMYRLSIPTVSMRNSKIGHLYRHYDDEGNLLYIGESLDAVQRLGKHAENAHWFSKIKKVEIEFFPSKQAALVAEQLAILNESPLFNLRRPKEEQ